MFLIIVSSVIFPISLAMALESPLARAVLSDSSGDTQELTPKLEGLKSKNTLLSSSAVSENKTVPPSH